MRIWIVNYYTRPDCTNPRYLEFAKHFMAKGWEVTTFYANYWDTDRSRVFERQKVNGLDFIEILAPRYDRNSLKRLYSIWVFAWRLYKCCMAYERPDVILHNVHIPFDYPIVWIAKKMNAVYIAEAWDLWPESFVRFGLVKESNPLMKIAHAIEKRNYCSAKKIIFTLQGAIDYLRERGWTTDVGGKIDSKHVYYINNGIDLELFDKNREAYPRPDEDINSCELKKIVYLGSISKANDVKTLIDAAALMMNLPDYRFFIYGNGTYRQELIQYVADNHIDNVVFKEERIPFEECAWVVSQATVNVMNYQKGFGKWGVSSGKMFQYLAAGKPIVCNRDFKYDNVIKNEQLGIAREFATPEDFVMAIRELAEQPRSSYDNMCERVRNAAERFDYKRLAEKEIKVIESAMAN